MTENNDQKIIDEKLYDYKKANTLQAYRKAIATLNKYHDPKIVEVFWDGLKTKDREDFPLVAFFATVSALEAYGKDVKLLEIFIKRWKKDYEEKMLNDLTIHRAIEVIHIIVNEAFQSFRDNDDLNNLLVTFFQKKVLDKNSDGVYKTIDSFKFFPKKIGDQTPKMLMQGLAEVIAKYFEQQLLSGKCFNEILIYIDFFTGKIGKDITLEIVRRVEKKYKSELFFTSAGKYTVEEGKGDVYALTAIPFAYSESFKELELGLKGIGDILNQLGEKTETILYDIDTSEIEKEFLQKGKIAFLENRETFELIPTKAKETLGNFPPVIPALVINNGSSINCVLNIRYANKYFEANGGLFTIFGNTVEVDGRQLDKIEGVIIEKTSGNVETVSDGFNENELNGLLEGLASIVSDVSVEIKRLETEKNDFLQKALQKEIDFDVIPFLGFSGENERDLKKKSMEEMRTEYENVKMREIISAFCNAFKQRAIEQLNNISSLSALANLVNSDNVIRRLTQINGPFTQCAKIIENAILKKP